MKRGEALAPRTLDEYRRMLKSRRTPLSGGIAPGEITKAHVRALVDSIRAEGTRSTRNRVSPCSRAFSPGRSQGSCLRPRPAPASRPRGSIPENGPTATPSCAPSSRPCPTPSLKSRAPIPFTATRSEEARSARWEDMDLERRVWTIPDVKQGGTHVLPSVPAR